MTYLDVEELDDEHEQRRDFRRANGAPLVSDPENPDKTLRYSRPSSYAKCLDDEEALVNWRIWKAMEGVARSPALQTQVVATHNEDRTEKKMLRERAMDKGAANERADQGTGLHAMTVRAEDTTDVDFNPPEQFTNDLDAYRDALATYGLVSEMTEVHMVNDEFRAAGTADRIFRTTRRLRAPSGLWIEEGDLIAGDLKTGSKLDFSMPGYAVQLALYAHGKLYDIHTERRLATPPIHQDWGVLIHLPVGKARCDVLWVDLEIGQFGAWLAKEVKEWRRKWKNGTHDCPAALAPTTPVEALIEAFPNAEVGPEVSLGDMAAYCQARITTIGQYEQAKTTLIARWPEGLPTPRKGIESFEQINTLLTLLDRVEAEYSIPFLHPDPRTPHGAHRSALVR
jgi:hypothetical protein